jgi:FlaG/FlaF family flagellin (archaellin)
LRQGAQIKLDQVGQQCEKRISEYAQECEYESGGLYRQSGVMGKIDLKIPQSKVTINLQKSSSLMKLQSLLVGMNISAKNYTNIAAVHIGSSGWFRVLNSILSDLGKTSEEIITIYNITSRKTKKTISNHKYHMRFIYELMGVG